MCVFYNKTNEPCTIWFHATSWDPGRGEIPVRKNLWHSKTTVPPNSEYIEGLGGMKGQLVVTTGGVTVPKLGADVWYVTNYQAFEIDDHHGWFSIHTVYDSNQYPVKSELRVYNRNSQEEFQQELLNGHWKIERYPQNYVISANAW